MKIEGTHTLKGPREKVWKALIDPEIIARCIPGCQKLEPAGGDSYNATLTVGIASIKGNYTGSVKLEDKTPPSHYKMIVSGKSAQGFVKGEGTIDLSEAEGQTIINYAGDVQIGGTLASVGQRMVQSAAKMMASQFFTAIEAEVAALVEAEAKAQPVIPPKHGFFRTLMRYLRGVLERMFGRKDRS